MIRLYVQFREGLYNTSMKQDQGPDNFFVDMIIFVRKDGWTLTFHRSQIQPYLCPHGITVFYKDIKLMMYGDPTLDFDRMQNTIRHMYVGELSSGGAKV